MTNKTDTVANSSFLSAEINISEIFDSVLTIIQGLRSSDSITPGRIPKADENLTIKDGESLFNAFMRSLGMPAVREEAALKKAIENISLDQKSQDGTINYFDFSELGLTEGDVFSLIAREREIAKQPLEYQATPDKDNVKKGLQFMLDPLDPKVGLEGSPGRRAKLFPLVACGDVTVYPTSNRIKPIFSKDPPPGGYAQQRSFLEFIIRAKIAAKPSVETDELKKAIKDKILKIAVSEGSKDPDPLINEKQAIVQNIEDQGLFELRVIQKLFQALEASAIDYAESIKLVRGYMQDVSYVPVFNNRSPFVLQGNFEIKYEDIIKFLDASDTGLKDTLGINKKPRIDAAIEELELEKLKSDQFFSLMLPPSESNSATRDVDFIFGAGAGSAFGTGTFEDIVVSICTLDRNRVENEIKEKEAESNRIRSELENLRSRLDIYSGDTSGFSIFDFLAIILSLFILPTETLSGLINKEGKNRAKDQAQSGLDGIEGAFSILNSKAPADARKDLEKSVTQILNIASAAFNKAKTGSK